MGNAGAIIGAISCVIGSIAGLVVVVYIVVTVAKWAWYA